MSKITDAMQEYIAEAHRQLPRAKSTSRIIYVRALRLACDNIEKAREGAVQDRRAMLAALMQEDTETIERFLREYHKHLGESHRPMHQDAPRASEGRGDTSPPEDLGTEQDGGASSAVRGHGGFHVGQRVKFVKPGAKLTGEVGIIRKIDTDTKIPIKVQFPGDDLYLLYPCGPTELEVVPYGYCTICKSSHTHEPHIYEEPESFLASNETECSVCGDIYLISQEAHFYTHENYDYEVSESPVNCPNCKESMMSKYNNNTLTRYCLECGYQEDV